MTTETIEKPRVGGPGSSTGGGWRVIVLNDNHNTFDHVANTLARVIPNMTVEGGYRIAEMWTGERELAELYWEQLEDAGLTMAPLEKG
jgi:ATP-dependent Clp protease adaptor protein ClpS